MRGQFKHGRILTAFGLGLALQAPQFALAQSVAAQPADDSAARIEGLDAIIVTATRRLTNVQDTPLAITAISGESLRDRNISDPRQLSGLAPNLYVDQGLGTGNTHVSLRGLASTEFNLAAASPVAIYIDDVFQPFQYGLGTQVFDLNRIEVLRGPQGTLFGKNTIAGALNYYSQTPTPKQEGYLKLRGGGGAFGHQGIEGAFNQPLTDQLAMRASVRVDRRDDYIDNRFNGGELGGYTNYNARVQFAWALTSETNVNLKLYGLKLRGDGEIYVAAGAGADPLDSVTSTSSDNQPRESYENYGTMLKIDQAFGDYQLTSITGAQKGRYFDASNGDGLPIDIFHSRLRSRTSQVSQEVRLATPANERLEGVFGLYGQYDRINTMQGNSSTLGDATTDYAGGGPGRQGTTTLAAFGSLTFDISEKLSVIGGMRYSHEKKDIRVVYARYTGRDLTDADSDYPAFTTKFPFDPATDYIESHEDNRTWNEPTWDVTANYKPTGDSLVYAKIATGFRSGGFPVGLGAPQTFVALKPEKGRSYEAGFKTEWLERKLRVNGDLFWMDYTDMQVQTPNTEAPGFIQSNAGKSRARGAELEIQAVPVTGFELSGTLGYTDAKYLSYGPQTGNRLPYAPRWTGNVDASYEAPVGGIYSISAGTNWTYRALVYFDPYQQVNDPSRFIGNARLGFGERDKGWRITAYVDNLTNLEIRAFAYSLGALQPTVYAPKRTWGIEGSWEF